MPIKFRKSLTLRTLVNDARNEFQKSENRIIMKNLIKTEILKGRSPVEGERFKPYSERYSKLKGRKRPVDMLVTGEMIESLRVFATRTSVRLVFLNKVAGYHNATGRVIQRLLPSNRGERFKKSLNRKFLRIMDKAFKIASRKQGRR